MISRRIYMKLDWDHAGIPVCVADSPSELARLCGTSLSTVSHAVAKSQKNPSLIIIVIVTAAQKPRVLQCHSGKE